MSNINQEVDAIIESEGIDNSIPAIAPDEPTTVVEPTPIEEQKLPDATETGEELPTDTPNEENPSEDITEPVDGEGTPPETSLSETVQQAKTMMESLNITEDSAFRDDGTVVPFEEIVPAGAYFNSQLQPVSVVGKDGKTYEFQLISQVEDKFPDGFEAKNNLEQMRFQDAILANEAKFREVVKTYENAKSQYTTETNAIVQSRGQNEQLRKEYIAMADAGIVPKVEGSPDDPKFLESAAVKELNTLLEFMDTKNKELSSKGLGQINSLYIAKQMMSMETKATDNDNKAKEIIKQRNQVASLSSNPAPDTGKPKQYSNIPMSRLADEIIASEGLK